MNISLCGIDCNDCEMNASCAGCAKTCGRPFGGDCMIAECCKKSGSKTCKNCVSLPCELKNRLIAEFNALNIADMEEVTELNALPGAFVNMQYNLKNGQSVKLLEDNKIYLGNQLEKKGTDRCYGLAADENYLLVCEYGENGTDPKIIVYKKR